MELKDVIKHLRAAADALEVLLGFNHSAKSAEKIREGLHWSQDPRKARKRAKWLRNVTKAARRGRRRARRAKRGRPRKDMLIHMERMRAALAAKRDRGAA